MQKSPPIYCLHGFLGLPSDWDEFPEFLGINLYQQIKPLSQWARDFIETINQPGILLGYSLGARLAMHSLIADPNRWKGAVLISGHPGLPQKERNLRYQRDLQWALKFRTDRWSSIVKEWNSQNIFSNSQTIHRIEKNFDRESLASMLETWSLGLQEDLTYALSQLKIPILWIAGEYDEKFAKLAIISNHPKSKIWIAPRAGHRVPWDVSKLFYKETKIFCREIS